MGKRYPQAKERHTPDGRPATGGRRNRKISRRIGWARRLLAHLITTVTTALLPGPARGSRKTGRLQIHEAKPDEKRSVPSRAVDSLAQQVRVAVVPGVLLDHVDINPAQAHVDVPVRMKERLV